MRSTIEQAAKRLAQLQNAGVEVNAAEPQGAAEAKLEPLPLRVARELDGRQVERRTEEAATLTAVVEEVVRGPARLAAPAVVDLARLSAEGYLTPDATRSRLAEEFRVIKRPLLNNAAGKGSSPVRNANRIMVTSSLPGEGKTYVSVNLALSLATEVDTRVLLVDADASRPAVLERLGIAPSKGLLDLLVDPSLRLEDVVLSTNIERLSILPAGSPQQHATELLASHGMSRLVERLASEDAQRIILFDTPPLLVTSEARVLAAHMGQVVMVIAADDTPQGTVAEALSTIDNCPVVFTLLNRVAQSERGHYYGSYGHNLQY